MKTLCLQLREASATCSNVEYRVGLKNLADGLQDVIKHFYNEPTEENLRAVQNAWTLSSRVLEALPPEGTPAPLSGSPEAARLAA
jgi:hypothetical protein